MEVDDAGAQQVAAGDDRVRDERVAAALQAIEELAIERIEMALNLWFAPRPERVAAELLRVCRPGGMVSMGNWTKEGFVGEMFKTFARFLMPPDMPSPLLWGDERVVRERFGAGVSDLKLSRVLYRFDYPFGPAEVVEFFRQYYGPATRAFATLGDAEQAALRAELVQLWSHHNTAAAAGRTTVDGEYLHVVATRS